MEKILCVSAISPYFIMNKSIVKELMKFIEYDKKSFWKIYLNTLDRNQLMGSSYQEIYLNYVAKFHPSTYEIQYYPCLTATLDKVTDSSSSIINCSNLLTCKEIFENSYTNVMSYISKDIAPIFRNITPNQTLLIPYLTYLKQFISSITSNSTIVEIGCGNFIVNYPWIPWNIEKTSYIGIDCVESVIAYNSKKIPSFKFIQQDATSSILPQGDICIIKNVFQYLCFIHIEAILQQLHQFNYIIITDEQPTNSPKKENKDHPTGYIPRKTGLWIEQAPFNYTNVNTVLELPIDKFTVSRTIVLKNV